MDAQENEVNIKSKSHDASNIIIVGMAGAGKSSVGKLLALQIGFGFLDLDEWIETKANKKISQIFAESGEQKFRELESKFLSSISSIKNHVVVVGGGTLEDDENFKLLLKMGHLVWVDCPIGEIVYRFKKETSNLEKRPLLAELIQVQDPNVRATQLRDRLQSMLDRRKLKFEHAGTTFMNSYSTIESGTSSLKELLFIKGVLKNKTPRYLRREDHKWVEPTPSTDEE